MKRLLVTVAVAVAFAFVTGTVAGKSTYQLYSPDRRTEIQITARDHLSYSVLVDGKLLLRDCRLALKIEQSALGLEPKVLASKQRKVNQQIAPQVPQKFATLHDYFNELRLTMYANYAVVFRVYNDAVAYRFETSLPEQQVRVYSEEAVFNFAGDYLAYYPREQSFFSHNEREFVHLPLKNITSQAIASVPAVIEAPGGVKIAISDADVDDYPGLWFEGTGGNALAAIFPPYPLEETLKTDRDFKISKAADFLAVTRGTREFPWRVVGIARKDGELLTSQIIYLLAQPSQVQDASWIKPGKVAWDWYNANNLYGVDFKAGINIQTYKYYIDFASRYGLEYVILDEGWYKLGNLLSVVPDMDIAELTAYARQKNVGIILWVVWKTLMDQLEQAFDQFERWGVKGIKVDFMQRDDQPVINFYHRVCREAAKRKMIVDFHGAVRPATMTRTWPNLLSTEGVRGLEQNKWGNFANPEHNVTLPFTRMFLGPMDYTPGAMVNASQTSFVPVFERPMSMGTRCHQLAMYVVYESPLQMLADSPSQYLREPEVMEFLGPVPTVWDETRVLDARLGDFVLVARRKAREWYVGAMTDWTARELTVNFSFLPAGDFRIQAYQDGVNANRYGSDFKRVQTTVNASTTLKISLAAGGGWAARIYPAL